MVPSNRIHPPKESLTVDEGNEEFRWGLLARPIKTVRTSSSVFLEIAVTSILSNHHPEGSLYLLLKNTIFKILNNFPSRQSKTFCSLSNQKLKNRHYFLSFCDSDCSFAGTKFLLRKRKIVIWNHPKKLRQFSWQYRSSRIVSSIPKIDYSKLEDTNLI